MQSLPCPIITISVGLDFAVWTTNNNLQFISADFIIKLTSSFAGFQIILITQPFKELREILGWFTGCAIIILPRSSVFSCIAITITRLNDHVRGERVCIKLADALSKSCVYIIHVIVVIHVINIQIIIRRCICRQREHNVDIINGLECRTIGTQGNIICNDCFLVFAKQCS